MIRSGEVDTRKSSGIPLGIGAAFARMMPDKYYDMSLGDQVFTQSNESSGKSVEQTIDGGYILCGSKRSISNGINDIYLIKTDDNGVEQWSDSYGSGILSEIGYSVQQTIDEGYIITGVKENINQGTSDIYLVKTDENGNYLWNKTIGGINSDESYSVQQTNDGGYIICGGTKSFGNGNIDVYLIKTDGNGNVTSTFNIPIHPNRKLQKTVDILGKETKPRTNIPLIKIYNDGTVEKKIIIE